MTQTARDLAHLWVGSDVRPKSGAVLTLEQLLARRQQRTLAELRRQVERTALVGGRKAA